MVAKSFGEFMKQKRIATGQTLRAFCAAHGFDVGNFSKMERGLLAPPHGDDRLNVYAEALGLERESSDWFEFFDLASAVPRGDSFRPSIRLPSGGAFTGHVPGDARDGPGQAGSVHRTGPSELTRCPAGRSTYQTGATMSCA